MGIWGGGGGLQGWAHRDMAESGLGDLNWTFCPSAHKAGARAGRTLIHLPAPQVRLSGLDPLLTPTWSLCSSFCLPCPLPTLECPLRMHCLLCRQPCPPTGTGSSFQRENLRLKLATCLGAPFGRTWVFMTPTRCLCPASGH